MAVGPNRMSNYALPSCPSVLCENRFSIPDTEDVYVPFWSVFSALLRNTSVRSTAQLVDVLETIALERRGKSDSDYKFFKDFLVKLNPPDFFYNQVWPRIKEVALEMPLLFPEHKIPILNEEQPEVILTRRQVACLVVRQFLCTLTAPIWQDGFQDFHIWYSGDQPHASAVEAYLTALLQYFYGFVNEDVSSPLGYGLQEWPVRYVLHTLRKCTRLCLDTSTPLIPLEVLRISEATTSASMLGIPDGAAVISANKFVGFGRTGTQDETHVGASPECCPAVLLTPPLDDNQTLVVTGAEAMITVAGYGRDARCSEVLSNTLQDNLVVHGKKWKERTMIFMDAIELDLVECDFGLPDLLPGNVERELRKAYTGFYSYKQSNRPAYSKIYRGFWGCGTFGGNLGIKTLIQWCAASFAGCSLTFICSGDERRNFGDQLEEFVGNMKGKITADEFVDVLKKMKPEDVGPGESPLIVVRNIIRARHAFVSG